MTLKFVSQKSKEKQNSSGVRKDGKQFSKPDYYEDINTRGRGARKRNRWYKR